MNDIEKLFNTINSSIDTFQSNIPSIQKQIMEDVLLLAKNLKLRNGRLVNTMDNFRILSQIKAKLEKTIISKQYKDSTQKYLQAFNEVAAIQNRYFSQFATGRTTTTSQFLNEVKKQSIESAVNYLTEAGIHANVISKVQDIIRQNITSGGKFSDFSEQMHNFIVSNESGAGALERYTNQIVTDSLNQYSRQYMNILSNDLGLEWYMYVGSLKETSRPWCEYLTRKKYIHKSELSTILHDHIDGTEICSEQIPCNKKTKLPNGMIADTNELTVLTYAGGYNCGHKFVPVDVLAVPPEIMNKLYASEQYKLWAKQNGVKAKES